MKINLKRFTGITFPRGVHPKYNKELSVEKAVEILPTPAKILVPLLQNIGAMSVPVVKSKQEIVYGEKIADGKGYISASIHSPVSGIVQKPTVTTLPNGRHVPVLPIKTNENHIEGNELWDLIYGGDWLKKLKVNFTSEGITEKIYNAGIVGLGGAAFPSHVKIAFNYKNTVDTFLVNGCECEPYLTTDYRLMVESPESIVAGSLLAGKTLNTNKIYICIEDNKPEAIKAIEAAAKETPVKVVVLKTKYPQGSERHLVRAVTNRIIPLGGIPVDVDVAVNNVSTVSAVAGAVLRGNPLTHRIVTVTGRGIKNPKNIMVPIGTQYKDVIEYCGGLTDDAVRVVSGGPMMGFAFTDFDMPITKGTSGITVFTKKDIKARKETACIKCGRCVDVCPMRLVPAKLAQAVRHRDIELAQKYNILACMESGCCGYICPAGIPLVQLIRMGKAMIVSDKKNKEKIDS
ncbi:MAG: electron transport complex subunit RsxC [Desulfobacterales bacterium]|nr:electron transport complex subunit RsxC [Desulfobacterales bacterium]